MPKPIEYHECKVEVYSKHYEEIDRCWEDEEGLWASNYECDSPINYCPYCGYKSEIIRVIPKKE